VDYCETPPPPGLSHLVKASWTLATPGGPESLYSRIATPDGCVEIIRRVAGRSIWKSEQPACFVAGLVTRPAELHLSGGSRFVGLRLWPWTWTAIATPHHAIILDDWRDLAEAAPGFAMPDTPGAAIQAIDPRLVEPGALPLIEAILGARRVAEIARRSGRSHRSLQRWFKQRVGVPPRTYLRLLRFNQSFEDLPNSDGTLANHAADHGFADQAHMAREFRSLSGSRAIDARKKALGPFL
jgi:AraC-like DNA-binding protein